MLKVPHQSKPPLQVPATFLSVFIVGLGTVIMTAAAVAISVAFSLSGAKDLAKHNARITLTMCNDKVNSYLFAQAQVAENMQYLTASYDTPVAPINQSHWNASTWYLPWMERMFMYHSITQFEMQFVGVGFVDGSYVGCQLDPTNSTYVICLLVSQVGRNTSDITSGATSFVNYYSKVDGALLDSRVGTLPYDPRTRDFYSRTPRVKGFAMWSNVYVAALLNAPIVSYIKPLYSHDNSFLGVIAADLTMQQIDTVFKSILGGNDASVFLIDNNLRLVASTLKGSAFTSSRVPVDYQLKDADVLNNCQLSDPVNTYANDTWMICQLSIVSYGYQPLIDLSYKRAYLFPSSPCIYYPDGADGTQIGIQSTSSPLVQWCDEVSNPFPNHNNNNANINAKGDEEVFSLELDNEPYYAMISSMPELSRTAEMSWRLVVLLQESTQTRQIINGRNVAIGVTVVILVVVTVAITFVMHRMLVPLASVAADMKSAAYLESSEATENLGTWSEGVEMDQQSPTETEHVNSKQMRITIKPRMLSYLVEVATIQQAYWDMADELQKLKSYIPEHIRHEVLTIRQGTGNSVVTTGFSTSDIEMTRLEGSFYALDAVPAHPVNSFLPEQTVNKGAVPLSLTVERLLAHRRTPLSNSPQKEWDVQSHKVSSTTQSIMYSAPAEIQPISVAALSELQMTSRRVTNEPPPIFFGDNVLVDRDISVVLVNLVQFHRFALTHSGPKISKEHEAVVRKVHAITRSCGGVLETFLGDHFWVSFNATTLCNHHAVAATCFALEISTVMNNSAIQSMKRRTEREGHHLESTEVSEVASSHSTIFKAAPCGVTCGVSSGRAFVGPLGTEAIRRHTIISQAMPEAAALERQSIRYPNCGLLLGGDTIPAIEGYFQYLIIDASLLPGSGGKRRRIATVKAAMCAEGCKPEALRGISHLEESRTRRHNPYALVNASFEAFLEGRTAECTESLRLAEKQVLEGKTEDGVTLSEEAKISISMMGELIVGMLSMNPPMDGRAYRSPLGEIFMPIGDRILFESNILSQPETE